MPTFYVTYELCSRGESQYLGSDSNSDDLQWQFTIVFIIFYHSLFWTWQIDSYYSNSCAHDAISAVQKSSHQKKTH